MPRKPKIAVITPVYKESEETVRRCAESVSRQTVNCRHYFILDGVDNALVRTFDADVVRLPRNIGNGGAGPRGIGALIALENDADFIFFLDADNWFDPEHIEIMLKLFAQSNCDVVYAKRRVIFPDGEILSVDDPQDSNGNHVDTNCFCFSRKAAWIARVWAMYPWEFGSGEDRFLPLILKLANIKCAFNGSPTVNYLTHWRHHYQLAKKVPQIPLRSPQRQVSELFDPELYFQLTGILLPIPEGKMLERWKKDNKPPKKGLVVETSNHSPNLLQAGRVLPDSLKSKPEILSVSPHNDNCKMSASKQFQLQLPVKQDTPTSFLQAIGAIYAFQLRYDIVVFDPSLEIESETVQAIRDLMNSTGNDMLLLNAGFKIDRTRQLRTFSAPPPSVDTRFCAVKREGAGAYLKRVLWSGMSL